MNSCKCEWCHNKVNASGKGYCRRHYDQIREHGYILDVRTRCDDNRIVIKNDYAEMIITDSKDCVQGVAKISLEDVEKVKGYHWSDNGNGYIRSFVNISPLYLHRYLMDCPDDLEVDHINHDKYDNRRSNLRIVSHEQNQQNNNGKCYRLITGRQLAKPYIARVIKGGEGKCKYFATEQEAQSYVAEIKEIT